MAKIINNCGWVAHRALGGFFAGAMGWMLSIAVSRAIGFEGEFPITYNQLLDFFPGKSPVSTAISGCFIGTVVCMIEHSAYKSFLGCLLGVIGGLLDGFTFPLFENLFSDKKRADH